MAKTYKCDFADIEWQSITCKKTGEPCGNVRWCMEKGRLILTENAEKCPKRKDEKHDSDRNAEQQKKQNDSKSINSRVSDKRRK